MDDWRKAQIAAGTRDDMANIVANAHRFMDSSEAEWARVCITAHDASRGDDGECSDAALDAWHEGWFAGHAGRPITDCPHFAAGWFTGCCERRRSAALLPVRAEGYYHAPVGTFE